MKRKTRKLSNYAYAYGDDGSFGEEDPKNPVKKKPKQGVYTSQAQIDALNADLKSFAARHKEGMLINPEDVTSGKKIGDPLFQTIDAATGKPFVPSLTRKKVFTVPPEIQYNDIYQDNTGSYFYDDPQTGNATEVDPNVLNSKRFAQDRAAQNTRNQPPSTAGTVAKFAEGGSTNYGQWAGLENVGIGAANSIINLLEGSNPNDYSTQPIVNASTMHGMASPYKGFAFGDDGEDLGEEDMSALQDYADENGTTVEELLQQLSGQVAGEDQGDDTQSYDDTDQDAEEEPAPDEDDMQQDDQATPDYLESLTSADELYKYGGIHIKKKNRGKFTASAKKAGQSVQGFAAHVLANKKNYSSTLVKRANFARNAAKWHHAMGGNAGMYNSYAGGGWIKNAVNPAHKGYCTPMTKSTCTGHRRAFALMMKKKHGFHKKAMGGDAGGNHIEVEGREVMQFPNGGMYKVHGPSHEEGGVDMNVPDGTKIYSNRLTLDGKTMEQRKVARERRLGKLKKLMNDNPHDNFLRNSLDRTMETHQDEEQKDMALQKVANRIYNSKRTAAYGDEIGFEPDPGTGLWNKDIANKVFQMNAGLDTEVLNNQYPTVGNISSPIGKQIPQLHTTPTEQPTPYSGQLTTGDWVGLAGNAFNAIAPIINTRRNAKFTKPNINRYRGFGHDALQTNDAEQRIASGLRTSALTDIDTASNSQISRNRNSARGVNTLRNLDIATRLSSDKAKQGANDSFAKEMLGVLNNREGLQLTKDKYEMTGEAQRDIADKQDYDNYFTNMAQNLVNFGTNVQGIGRNLNVSHSNKVNANLISQMSKYGLGFDESGNVISLRKAG